MPPIILNDFLEYSLFNTYCLYEQKYNFVTPLFIPFYNEDLHYFFDCKWTFTEFIASNNFRYTRDDFNLYKKFLPYNGLNNFRLYE